MAMTVPNILTLARMVIIFVVLVIMNTDALLPAGMQQGYRAVGLLCAILAGFTDFLDGYIARKHNLTSDFGKFLDPLADKVFITVAYVMLVAKGIVPGWVVVIILTREFLVTGLRQLAAGRNITIESDSAGKLKTVCQMGFLILGGAVWVGWLQRQDMLLAWWLCLLAVVAITVYSGMGYFIRHRRLLIGG